jgi:hypothetical protein
MTCSSKNLRKKNKDTVVRESRALCRESEYNGRAGFPVHTGRFPPSDFSSHDPQKFPHHLAQSVWVFTWPQRAPTVQGLFPHPGQLSHWDPAHDCLLSVELAFEHNTVL